MLRFQSRAFTLLEILLVSAVIALLTAILLPGLNQAREQARRSSCQANLRNITIGWHSYLESSRGCFPQGINLKDSYGGKESKTSSVYRWPKSRRPLNRHVGVPAPVKESAMFKCPSDTGVPGTTLSCYDERGTSYSMNDFLVGQNQIPVDGPCAALRTTLNTMLSSFKGARIRNESTLLLSGDASWWVTYRSASPDWVDWHGRKHYHNVAYMDGHVSFIEIHKGLYVTPQYTVIPFRDLLDSAVACQQELPAP